MSTLNEYGKKSFKNIVGKGEIMWVTSIFPLSASLKFSSANGFTANNLSSWEEFTLSYTILIYNDHVHDAF